MIYSSAIQDREVSANIPKAVNLPPSQNWDGNDGAWSTFIIGVGTPPQDFRVVPSINGQETWVPIASNCSGGLSWCGNARGVEPFLGSPILANSSVLVAGSTCSANKSPMCESCSSKDYPSEDGKCTTGPCSGRYCCGGSSGSCNTAGCNGVSGICTAAYIGCTCTGGDYDAATNKWKSNGASNPVTATGFQADQSKTWANLGNHSISNGDQLGVSYYAGYGMDKVRLGPNSLNSTNSLTTNQTTIIARLETEPFYLGTLGLKPSMFSRFGNSTSSVMELLKSQNLLPSLSFGYTAGAIYRKLYLLLCVVLVTN